MIKLSSLKMIRAFSVGLALSVSTSALAETKTYCDDACNLKYCTFTCCHITWGPYGLPTGMNCSSSGCCAHPTGSFSDGFLLPGKEVGDMSGPIKWDLVRVKGLDASKIAIESEDKAKTITIRGAVKSAAERDLVHATAMRHAKRYKIVNQQKIKKKVPPRSSPPQRVLWRRGCKRAPKQQISA